MLSRLYSFHLVHVISELISMHLTSSVKTDGGDSNSSLAFFVMWPLLLYPLSYLPLILLTYRNDRNGNDLIRFPSRYFFVVSTYYVTSSYWRSIYGSDKYFGFSPTGHSLPFLPSNVFYRCAYYITGLALQPNGVCEIWTHAPCCHGLKH